MNLLGDIPLLSLAQVATILNIKDEVATKRWLDSNNVPIHTICKKKQVFRFDFDVALGIKHARSLKSKFAFSWQERYRLSQPNPAIIEVVLKDLSDFSIISQPTTRINVKTDSGKKLLTKLNNL